MDNQHESKLQYEYGKLTSLEQETTKTRHTTFTALISISFVLPGLALKASGSIITTPLGSYELSQFVFYLGFIFFCFATFHYEWYHRYSHRYRSALKKLELELGIKIYSLRERPTLGPFKFHFNWSLYIIGIVYAVITATFTGIKIFAVLTSFVVVAYLLLLLSSFNQPVEPLE